MANKNQWVSPRPNSKWAVRGSGNSRDTKVFDTQSQAIKHAISIARKNNTEVVIQDRNGRIRSKDSYGNDPCPPCDREH